MSRSLRIFVIEDYDDFREAICDALTKDGHQVVGVAMAEDVDDEPLGYVSDLYIIDLNLPGEDGISLARRIRRSQPSVGIVIVSARNAVEDRIDGYRSGANIYLTKPFSLEELRAVVSGFGERLTRGDSPEGSILILSPLRMIVAGPAAEARLTQPEVVLLAAFSRVAQQCLESWQVAAHLGNGEAISRENLNVKLGRLRKKLLACGVEAPAIQSLRGMGYKLCSPISTVND
jgi:DNA-binding response OmpR family regulator